MKVIHPPPNESVHLFQHVPFRLIMALGTYIDSCGAGFVAGELGTQSGSVALVELVAASSQQRGTKAIAQLMAGDDAGRLAGIHEQVSFPPSISSAKNRKRRLDSIRPFFGLIVMAAHRSSKRYLREMGRVTFETAPAHRLAERMI